MVLYGMILIALIFFIVLIFAFFAVIGLLGCCLACFAERRKLMAALKKTEGSIVCGGTIADAQLVQDSDPSVRPLHYKYAIHYVGRDGAFHRAFLGISTAQPISLRPGNVIPVRVFSAPVLEASDKAYDPARGADGNLPQGTIDFRLWLGRPVDETGTVMIEGDYQALCAETEKKCGSLKTRGWCFAGFAGGLFLLIAVVFLGMLL